ncbi:unnamed protein product (macronuclear) [Paramecium tetraurelia]|uniref:C-type lectin domain-containing protein n=1 Tax=Paramecium tetraurelia TaxID=5888 RepID=A0C5M1_PARTE|nr:uncharacterized protein GSPATT00035217001 [Paramecium tetraurelia]CAK66088.1 unnamed protein product [Paramecium tetraurelia]|eukprot:XP_001433485.1 hypothetical protein (macronuclear) [Paramecium tetraurelia strain d4-2]
MSASNLPQRDDDKLIVVPLEFKCLEDCVCKSQEKRTWYHKKCGKPSFINEKGDIFCENLQNGCSSYFIKDASFQCDEAKKNNTWYQFKNASEICMALGKALQAAENKLESVKLLKFTHQILIQLGQRWYT